jgi:hypothetical protein
LHSNIAVVDGGDADTVLALAKGVPTEPDARYSEIYLDTGNIENELPKSSIPLFGPTSNTQTLRQGTLRAYFACAYLAAVNVLIFGVGIGALIRFLHDYNAVSLVAFIFLEIVAFLFSKQFYPVLRILRYQSSWPIDSWRVDRKGQEKDEWKRWAGGIKWSDEGE